MTTLSKKTSDLLNFCLDKPGVELSYDSPVVRSFIIAMSQEKNLISKWSIAEAYDILFYLIDRFIEENHKIQPPVKNDVIETFIARFAGLMQQKLTDHWLILPLQHVRLTQVIKFNNYLLIPEKIDRKEKIDLLAELISLSKKEMNFRAEHTEKSRSPSFYEYALICHKVQHSTSWVNQMAQNIMLFDVAVLRVFSNSLFVDSTHLSTLKILDRREKNHHVLILAQEPTKWGHMPIWANDNSSTISNDLEWLKESNMQEKFLNLITLLGYEHSIDRLLFRFRRAILFFSKAIDINLSSHHSNEGFALELLHLMISIEGILLDRESEKRIRLAALLSRLVSVEGKTKEDIYNAVDNIYDFRSDYVHSGNDIFPEYDENYHEGVVYQNINLVRHVISKFLANAKNLILLAGLTEKDLIVTSLSDYKREKMWFKFLDLSWKSILSGSS